MTTRPVRCLRTEPKTFRSNLIRPWTWHGELEACTSAYRDCPRTDLQSCFEKKGMHALHELHLAYKVTILNLFHTLALIAPNPTYPDWDDAQNLVFGFRRLSESFLKPQQATQTKRPKKGLTLSAHLQDKRSDDTYLLRSGYVKNIINKISSQPD